MFHNGGKFQYDDVESNKSDVEQSVLNSDGRRAIGNADAAILREKQSHKNSCLFSSPTGNYNSVESERDGTNQKDQLGSTMMDQVLAEELQIVDPELVKQRPARCEYQKPEQLSKREIAGMLENS